MPETKRSIGIIAVIVAFIQKKPATNFIMIDILILIWEHLQHPLVAIIWIHFLADFILQTDYVALNKSKNSWILLKHVTIYSIPFLWFGWQFALINGALHFVTDYITSRTTSWLWEKEQRHWFFVTIGFDQAIHLTTLFVTYSILIGEIYG